ncbi:ScyD/ScyE family protein [Nocardioides caldifontis]|uniref:ScyD/ScyE family protein n=1 Tax=Nocardioides caldifontis TaxID=2588938 RepID=UPI001396CC0F|nr:ScyD/ScyE family protein [Nocardioides caldifontis]
MKPLRTLVGLTAAATAAVVTAGPATAAPSVDVIADGLVGPLGLHVSADGIYVAQNFTGTIDRVRRNGSIENVAGVPDASGFVVDGKRVVYTTTAFDDEGAPTTAALKLRKANGDVKHLASLLKFEKSRNPDGDQRYGVLGVSKSCRQKLPRMVKPYKGIIEAHPYAVADAPGGGWYVADAAGNDILHVNRKGRVKVVAVLEPVEERITKKLAKTFELPNCAVGGRAAFEAVPTDVEVAKNGSLVVSLLPGGPEDPSAGARGQVVRIDPRSGKQKVVAKGFAGATNVAIGKGGKIYVAELFGGRISQIGKGGKIRGFKPLNQPSAVEYYKGKLYVTYDTFPPEAGPPAGKVAVLDPTP